MEAWCSGLQVDFACSRRGWCCCSAPLDLDLISISLQCASHIRLPATCNVEDAAESIMLEQNTTSFTVRDAATSFASTVDCAVRLWRPNLKLIALLTSITIYEDVDLPLSELLP